ncbi:siderophore-interacting protein [Mycolicibacterium wolinskyi]|uniref:Phage tail protein n=1 Tax=Mycolicibacterium wolinskyi TaxID=59750 RepID=A0A1X2F4C3_9MYCO|nr:MULTISPECIES: siderophore-interacting protein [Mycolicibacterium]MCV7289090.1 siderophore-interacting protein [Mycolicibacterium wolinskyi]MCV7296517.1 siderophore-interacting protein [Mycolicibacterium goodii]ORX13281.1 phage tail protein [Mycolicibacterium wolinskyi]
MAEQKASRGIEGALVKLWRGGDYQLTVTGRTELTPHYLRLHFNAERLLAEQRLHPTMWVRGWFPDGARAHQRGYTLANPDREAGTVDIDFAMHDGVATRWARAAQPGDVLEVTVLGSNFALPEPQPAGYVIVGDTASLPAINSLLDAIGDAPARVFLEAGHDDDRELPVAAGADITWVDRDDEALVEAVSSSAFDAADHFGWVACNNRTTRAVARVFREQYNIPRKSIKAQAYWVA